MCFTKWHQGLLRRISEKNLKLVLLGKLLVWFAIGSYFSIQLASVSYIILTIGTILLAIYLNRVVVTLKGKGSVPYGSHLVGFMGGMLIVLYFGQQSPQVGLGLFAFLFGIQNPPDIRPWLIVIGILMGLPALFEMMKNKGNVKIKKTRKKK